MKRLFSLIALIMVSVAVTPIAEAKNSEVVSRLVITVTKRLRHLNSNNKKMTP